jgi:hypothetical protein
MVIAEEVVTAEEFNMDTVMAVTVAELLDEDFTNDDEAEFIQGLLEIELAIEDIIMSDTPEDFLLPTANDIAPALQLLEKIEELKNLRFGNRTIARMERRVRGVNLVVEEKLTQLEKSVHPAYKNWCCPKCLDYYKGARCLREHQEKTQKCKDNHTRLLVKATKDKVVDPIFYHTTNSFTEVFERAEQGRRQRMLELEAEEYEEEKVAFSDEEEVVTAVAEVKVEETHLDEDGFCKYCRWNSCYEESHIQYCGWGNCVYIQEKYGVLQLQEMMEEELGEPEVEEYVVKTWVYNTETHTIEYAGLFEVDGKDSWEYFQDAREVFNWAIQTGELIAVVLANKTTGQIEDEWEDNIDEYVEEEEENDFTPALEAYLQQEEAYKEGMKTIAEEQNLKLVCCLNCGLKKYVKQEEDDYYYCEGNCLGF